MSLDVSYGSEEVIKLEYDDRMMAYSPFTSSELLAFYGDSSVEHDYFDMEIVPCIGCPNPIPPYASTDAGFQAVSDRSAKPFAQNEILQQLQNKLLFGSIATDVHVDNAEIPRPAEWSIWGVPFTVPLTVDQAADLYCALDPSHLGVEGLGNVLDPQLRLSHEAEIFDDDIAMSFVSPSMIEAIRLSLCPSAISITARPYKIIVYGEGDFFKVHRDSMDDAMQFGSLVIQLPIVGQGKEAESDMYANVALPSDGHLVFYVGRDVAFNDGIYHERMKGEMARDSYGRVMNDADQLVWRLDMTTVLPQAPGGDVVKVKYAAWSGDVPHEVTPVRSGYRAVLLYRLFKDGHSNNYIPRALRDDVTMLVKRLFRAVPRHTGFDYLSIMLRHSYPPAGLVPKALKGIDAVAYGIIAQHFECYLHCGVEMRVDNPAAPFRLQSANLHSQYPAHFRVFFLTTARMDDSNFDCSDWNLREKFHRRIPCIQNSCWIQLGLGTAVAGGVSYGNWDCGALWWYRNAAMVVSRRPSRWKRYRPLFLAVLRGGPCCDGLRRLYNVQELFERVCSFL